MTRSALGTRLLLSTVLSTLVVLAGCGDAGTSTPASGNGGTRPTSGDAAAPPPAPTTGTPDAPGSPPAPATPPTKPNVFEGDPGADGPFAVYKTDVTVPASNGKKATVYAPSRDGGKTMVKGESFPLVVVLPGYQASYTSYEYMSTHMVSFGHVVVGIDFDDANDHTKNAKQVQGTIDWALGSGSPIAASIDPTKIATAGHSKGGKIAVYAASGDANTKYPETDFAGDPRIKIVLAWDPVDAGGPPCPIADGDAPGKCRGYAVTPDNVGLSAAKMIFFGGQTGDPKGFTCTPAGRTHAAFYAAAKATALHVAFPNSGHMDWLNDAVTVAAGKLVCGGSPTADPKEVQRVAKRTQMAWLLKWFGGYSGLEKYIDGATITSDCGNGALCEVNGKLL